MYTQVIIALIGSGLLSGTIVAVINAISNKKQQERELKYKREQDALTAKTADIESLRKDLQLLRDDMYISKEAQKSSLYFSIKSGCIEAINHGYIDTDSLEAITEAWEIYHNHLGGNGYLSVLMDKIKKLQIK